MQPDDSALWDLAKKGDKQAFGEIVARYEDRVFAHALRRCGNRSDAEEIAQETFLRLYKALQTFRGEANLCTWVHKITANLCTDHMRKWAKAAVPFSAVEDGGEDFISLQKDGERLPEEAAVISELRETLDSALKKLSGEHREIILLREIDGMSYEEIAFLKNMPLGTVRSRLARARLALRDLLRGWTET